jgi:hypothetical protein
MLLMGRDVDALAQAWAQQGMLVERGGVFRARCAGEVVEIPCELIGHAEDGRTLVCVGGMLDEYAPEEVDAVVRVG